MQKYILALDQGTTSSRAILFDEEQNIVGMAQKELTQIYPKAGYIEHDPEEIWSTQYSVLLEVLHRSAIPLQQIAGIGITNQRETTILWDKVTGRPVYNAIVWQCRRTAALCEKLKSECLESLVSQTTGLKIDAYFSATKIQWILENIPEAKRLASENRLLFGTVDTWLIWKLTNGSTHITDYTNASRTMLFDIHRLCWDDTLLKHLQIPREILPDVKPSSGICGYAHINKTEIPIAGIAGDQQAALFGQACFTSGQAKNTYGTGCFLLMHTGAVPYHSQNGLLTTIAATLNAHEPQYALEGSVFMGGAILQWLRDELHLLDDATDSEYFANKVSNNGGVYLVPAFTGLGAPYWDMYARGSIFGLTRGTTKNHIIRAALEAIAYQSKDVLDAIIADTGIALQELRVDGGASANNFLMQFQADILGITVRRPMIRETTALGSAYLSGLATGVWKSLQDIQNHWSLDQIFHSQLEKSQQDFYVQKWHTAVQRTKFWETHDELE